MFINFKWNSINKTILKKAIINTARNRDTTYYIDNSNKYIELIKDDLKLKKLWNSYRNNYEYAKNISFEDVLKAINTISEIIVPIYK